MMDYITDLQREIENASDSAGVMVYYAKEFQTKNPCEANQLALDNAVNNQRIIADAMDILSDLPGWNKDE